MTGSEVDIDGTFALLAGVLALGFRHGFDWDHIAAITDITSATVATDGLADEGRPDAGGSRRGSRWLPPRHAFMLGTLYALGHASVVAARGFAALLLGAVLPTWVDPILGRVVGVTLVALGLWLVFSAYRAVRYGAEFHLRSRWMLIFASLQRARYRLWGRPRGEQQETPTPVRAYGAGTSYGIGMIHGIGAETATQVLLIAAIGGAAGRGLGIPMMLSFIIGLVMANTVIVGVSAAGFAGAGNRHRLNIALGLIAGVASIAIGTLFVVGRETSLPDLTEMLGESIPE